MALSRSFKISLVISTLLHIGVFAALSQDMVAEKIIKGAEPTPIQKPKPKVVRFQLVETPSSAEAKEPPKNSNLVSDKNTRAQDRFEGSKKLADSPHMEGKHEDVKDTRPKTIISKAPPPVPPKAVKPREVEPTEEPPEKAEAAEEPKKEAPKPSIEPEKEPDVPEKQIEIAPEPEKKEVIKLAKKIPEPATPSPTTPSPSLMSAVSAKNTGADAQIMGELSYATTRHFFGEYLVKMKQAIEKQWVSLLVSKYTSIKSSEAVVDFKIQPNGAVTDVTIHSSEGDPYFPVICISSINGATPFERIPYEEVQGLPEKFVNKPLSIRFTFRYN